MLVRDSKSRCTSDSPLTVTCYSDVQAMDFGIPGYEHLVWDVSLSMNFLEVLFVQVR